MLILKRKCLFGAGRLNPLWGGWYSFNHNICTRCSSRHYGIGCHVPMFVSVLHPYQNIVAKDQKLFHTTLGTEFHHENFDHISPEFVRAFKKIWMKLTGLSQNSFFLSNKLTNLKCPIFTWTAHVHRQGSINQTNGILLGNLKNWTYSESCIGLREHDRRLAM